MIVTPRGFQPVVFIIGPMGKKKGKVGGVDISEHIQNIEEALRIANEQLVAEGFKPVQINTPDKARAHDLNEFVLKSIDACDIAVADISDRSPNVFYELAFLHSLGIPVITLDTVASQKKSPIPWYAKPNMVNTLDGFSVPEIAGHLFKDLKYLLGDKVDQAVFSNPISRIYNGIPLVDISAAAGLAAGHFSNFLRRILSTQDGPFAYRDGCANPLKNLIVVLPESVQGLSELEREFKKRINSEQKQHSFSDRQRPLSYNEYKGCVVDFPNPISALITSPRYKRISQILQNQEGAADDLLLKIEKRWIEAYFDALRQHEQAEHFIFKNRMKFMPLGDIEKLSE